MDFFQNQDKARTKTKVLVFYFGLAVVSMIILIYIGVAIAMNYAAMNSGSAGNAASQVSTVAWLHPEALLFVTIGVTTVIGLASLFKVSEIRRGGGEQVASMLGGRRISSATTDHHERVVMNVVEEMALASGIPVPPVYVLDQEPGINAFAAGFTPNDAVIGVNRGTIEIMNRAELQGVIAHEFSHIFNGDMRLNIRLIGWLFGIQMLAIIGYYMFRMSAVMNSGRSNNKNGGQIAIAVIVGGLAIMIVGYLGQICARMIQAAISRQREYLADASAVQFTRDPNTISGALKVIGASAGSSAIKIPTAQQASHMFFAEGVSAAFGGLSTHPPIADRIRKIDPQFDGNYSKYMQHRYQRPVAEKPQPKAARKDPAEMLKSFPIPGLGGDGFGPMGEMTKDMPGASMPLSPAAIIAGIGMLDDDHVQHSHEMIDSIDPMIKSAVHDPFSARCVVYGLLLDDNEAVRNKQLSVVQQAEGQATVTEILKLLPYVKRLPQSQRLPCLEIVQSTLSELSLEQYKRFGYSVIELVKADQQIDLFEFILQHLILSHLDRRFGLRPPAKVRYQHANQIKADIEMVLAVLVYVGHADEKEAANAFRMASDSFGEKVPFELIPKSKCNFQLLDKGLERINEAAPKLKKQILHAAATAVAADEKITISEAELFRAFAESIECPVPPILATE